MSYIRRNSGFGDYQGSTVSTEYPFHDVPSKGGCGCGGTCGGCGDDHSHGMGLFDSMDPTTWGAGEYIVGGVGAYLAISAFQDVSKAGRAVKKRASKKVAVGGVGALGLLALAGGAYYLWSKSAGGGLGDYQKQLYVNPQILVAPGSSAQIRIPAGW